MGNIFTVQISCDTVFSRCLDCFVTNAKHVRGLKDNLVALQTELQKLIEARDDVMTRVINAEQKQMKRLNQVQGWLSRVETLRVEVDELVNDSSCEIEKLSLAGSGYSNRFKWSYKFAKKVAKKLQVVATLKGEGAFEAVAERIPETSVDEIPIEPTIVGQRSILDKIWRWLREERVGIIGLYGMGGVGKTTILTQINNKFLSMSNNFDVVIWVVVSKELEYGKIQDDIGKKIGLCDEPWKNRRLEEKALDIFKILSKKKFVLLLDDIWKRVDLNKIGVPLPAGQKIESKLVFTTRFIEICGEMRAHKSFRVECLRHEKAWILFQENVGRHILDSHPDIPALSETVAKECGGLPLALITIGRAMACKKTPEEWEYAIQVLRRSASEFPGMDEVYPRLKFSYDSLPNYTIKSCFLYCCLFPEDYKIYKTDLIDYWIGEGILDGYDGHTAKNKGYYIIGVLLHACLLEEVDEDHVKMHDVIRDMTLWIACEIEREKENFLVHAGHGLTKAPEIEIWGSAKRLSLMGNRIEILTKAPTSPHLLTLFLNRNRLRVITNDFFDFMPSLKVLNLSYNRYLTELPRGISRLVSLQHLNLSGTDIEELPKELISLVNLKCLNLEHTRHLRLIPRQLISNFLVLGILRMFDCGSFNQPKHSVLYEYVLVEELVSLKNLSLLSIDLKSSRAVQRILSFHKLLDCIQSLCLRYLDDSKALNIFSLAEMKHLNTLYIVECEFLEELKIDWAGNVQRIRISQCFHSLSTVEVHSCYKLKDLTWAILARNLKKIKISYCPDMEEIISAGKLDEVRGKMENLKPFAKLEFLGLENLDNLKSIYWNPLPFPYLKEIRVNGCPHLRKLPLDSKSGKEHKIFIRAKQYYWWETLQWEDQATQNAFHHCFIHA
ncbi:NBS-LRR type disease resistance protein [Melia azedarach]|uniref:NBS-LRR type disease resistance protein n=1 Tax=Melia azedarach TaxID=155640 RepID=A0ACC1Y3L6_MELAZ|nr:NBS-LRR type disease resistance protein [Melia azedarach]